MGSVSAGRLTNVLGVSLLRYRQRVYAPYHLHGQLIRFLQLFDVVSLSSRSIHMVYSSGAMFHLNKPGHQRSERISTIDKL